MKKILGMFMLLAFLFSATSYAQCSKVKQNSTDVTFQYGTANTLGAELTKTTNNTIVGVGYSRYVGNEAQSNVGANNYTYVDSYRTRYQAFYLLVGKKINKIILGLRGGICNDANNNRYVTTTPISVIHESKSPTDYEFQYGGYVGYKLNDKLNINLGYDTFNQGTLGLTLNI